ncbi:LAGLIDADG family homing endonuclease [Deinococcus sp. YIM 77859]|uniref:LAGLIDADG family homing endonuclease n=1 Tax=Deinococcus sp. YIM 77859 TaxID=1540221 RepID=UPI0005530A7B|nr:LAGLIDADG family homing endonuclease [Deinococcus sp. YIM 77859]
MTTAPDPTLRSFDENAQHIARRQYLQPGDGDIGGMFRRIAHWVAQAEAPEAREHWAQKYFDLMAEKKFCPGGRVLAGAGTQHGNVLNCFVQGATEHDPASFDGIMEVAKKLALVTKVGGGNGVNLDVYAPRAQSSRPDAGVRGWVYMSATHADVTDFIAGLMRPPTQPDGDKQPVAVRNWTRVVYGEAISPELVAAARQNGVQIVRALPSGVQAVPDDMGGIIDAARAVAESAKVGVEPRIDLSGMRPEGAPIKGSGGTSSGPVSFLMEIFDNFLEWANRGGETSGPVNTLRYVYAPVLRVVRQGGTRRGAGMATMAIEHPDVLDFLTAKDLDREAAEGDISTFNISILVSEKFWQALERDALWHVDVQEVPGKYYLAPQAGTYGGRLPALPDRAEDGARAVPLYRSAPQGRYNPADKRPGVPAKWLWDQIAQHAWATGEPGLIFVDRVNEYSALKNLGKRYEIRSTNPCVTADTWVMTAAGARQVHELIHRPFEALIDGVAYPTVSDGFFLTGVKPVVRLTTTDGYEVRLTSDHRVLRVSSMTRSKTRTEWVAAGDLLPGDKVVLHDHREITEWSGDGMCSDAEGYRMGLGTLDTDGSAILSVWPQNDGTEAVMAAAESTTRPLASRGDFHGWQAPQSNGQRRLRLAGLTQVATTLELRRGRTTITPEIERQSRGFYCNFLRGLFDAKGSVQGTQVKGVSVRLAHSDLEMLKAVQRMLLRLGIGSTISQEHRAAGAPVMGGSAHKAQHELVLAGENVRRYAELIGFEDTKKAERLKDCLESYGRELNRERFVTVVESIVDDGIEEVYDVTVSTVHAFDANGLYVHNCGEIPLTVGEPCDLGAINLAAYVKGSSFNYAAFRADVRTCVRFLDDVLDVNVFALEDNRVASQDLRRLGLGVMGLADALIKLGLRYDSEAGRQAIHDIMTALREEAVAESERLGQERGVYPVYERNAKKIPHQPRRNVAVLTVAPTGTTSMLMGVSSGIEPVFSPFIWRKIGAEYRALLHPLFMELLSQYPPAANMEDGQGGWNWDRVTEAVSENHGSVVGLAFIPEALQQVFVCAHDIKPVDHVRMQGTVQRAFDAGGQHAANSLSKTINLPNSATVQDVQDAYSEAYRTGCKGITVYRDGSRQFQVLSTSKKKEKKVEEPVAAEAVAEVMGESGQPSAVSRQPEAAPAPAVPTPAPAPRPAASAPTPVYERPARLSGITDMVKLTDPTSGHRRSFLVTVNHLNGKPVEVMVISGRAGDEANADSEALGRVVSIALQHGVPAQAIIKTLRGINGGLYGSYNGRLVGSKADLIAVALETFAKDMDAASLPPLAGASVDTPAAPSGVSVEGLGRERCPVCEEKAVIREEGCLKCQACGYSKCG